MTTCVITLWAHTRNIIDKDRVSFNNAYFNDILFILKAIKSHFKGPYDRILHSWSFYTKFMKLAEARFITLI